MFYSLSLTEYAAFARRDGDARTTAPRVSSIRERILVHRVSDAYFRDDYTASSV